MTSDGVSGADGAGSAGGAPGARRTLRLWWELMVLSRRELPGLTAASLAALAGSVLVVAATGLSLKAAVDATIRGAAPAAVAAAVCAGVAYALSASLTTLVSRLTNTTNDRLGRLVLHPRVHHEIAALEGLEHLERSDFLDRVTLVRSSTAELAAAPWSAARTVAGVLRLGVTLLLLGAVNPWLLLLLPLAAAPTWADHRGQRAVRTTEVETAEEYRLQQHLLDLAVQPATAKEVLTTGSADGLIDRQAAGWDAVVRLRAGAAFRAAAWGLGGWTVFAAGFTAALALVAHRTSRGEGTVGDLVLTVTVAATVRQSLQGVVTATAATAASARIVEPYLWLRDYAAAARAGAGGGAAPPAVLRDGITLTGVGYTYPGTGQPALADFSARLPAGSVVAVVGEYGSGKTTLVKLLAKFYRPDSGTVLVDGVPLAGIDTEAWRARSSAAFQDFGRFRTTFADTVGLGDVARLEDRAAVEAAVRAADAEGIVAGLPDGLDTQLGRELGGVELSEGQWQRAALARASMRPDPLLFVLDEPTASLDAVSEQAIFERYMARAAELGARTGAVTVIVSHRFSTVTGADLILVLHRGRLAESGDHATLMALNGRYAELYGLQAAAYSLDD
ncbi:ATP-binding cassette domain-containing protein [Streptacidiphilus cavernicola]|uniref:ATP-binding cassette domain-containing protein n=1 Tax=Streptacidiphilus cavernicola TaxID=3342716 RepID=A0ABV6W379_9ACTN